MGTYETSFYWKNTFYTNSWANILANQVLLEKNMFVYIVLQSAFLSHVAKFRLWSRVAHCPVTVYVSKQPLAMRPDLFGVHLSPNFSFYFLVNSC